MMIKFLNLFKTFCKDYKIDNEVTETNKRQHSGWRSKVDYWSLLDVKAIKSLPVLYS